jgi:hypothetical protein
MIKTLKLIPCILFSLLLLWFALSYLEIIFKNLNNPIYSNYNLIIMVFKNFDKLLYGGIF